MLLRVARWRACGISVGVAPKVVQMPLTKKRVIVVGGGFGGLNAAKALIRNPQVEVLLLDRRNHHLFQPLLYQVAMAGLSPAEIATPIRSVFRGRRNIQVLLAKVQKILPAKNQIETDLRSFQYDYLILACGSEHSYFGHNQWEDLAPGLKTLEQATEIRRRVLMAFESAEAEEREEPTRAWLTFVIIGGGPTGVELAGALGEITRFTLSKDFRRIDPTATRVILIEAGDRVLSSFHKDLSERATRDLEHLGVQVRTKSRVSEITSEGVRIGDEWIHAKTVIWAAGVSPSPLNQQLESPMDSQGRVRVNSDLALDKFKNIFVIGDQALFLSEGVPLPGLAPVAMQQGRWVARQIGKDLQKKPREPFVYNDKGQMATIGRKSAVLQMGRFQLTGLLAWWAWLFIHIYYLIGFKNRFFVMWEWAFSYMSYKRGARLITKTNWH